MHPEEWRLWAVQERRNSSSTLVAYDRDLLALATYADRRGWSLTGLTPAQIRQWLRSRGGSDKTVSRRCSALHSYYSFLVAKGLRSDNPMDHVRRPMIPPKPPRPVLDARDRIRELPEPYRSIATLVYETGMSIGEVTSIDLQGDVGDEIRVQTRRGRERSVPLTRDARAALRRLQKLLPTGWMSMRTIQRHLRTLGITMQGLRHTTGAELAAERVDVGMIRHVLGLSPTAARAYEAYAQPTGTDELRKALERRGRHSRLT